MARTREQANNWFFLKFVKYIDDKKCTIITIVKDDSALLVQQLENE